MAWNSQPGAYTTSGHDYYGQSAYVYPSTASASSGSRQADGYAYQQQGYATTDAWASQAAQGYGGQYDSAHPDSTGAQYYGRRASESEEQGAESESTRQTYRRIAWTPEEDYVLLNIIEELCRTHLWKAVKAEGGLVHRNANGIRTRTGVLLNKIRRKVEEESRVARELDDSGSVNRRAMDISSLTSR